MTHLHFTAAPAQAAAAIGSATTRPNRLRESVLNLVISGIALVVALGLAEWLVRRVAPQQLILLRPDVWQPADSLGWVNRPNVNTRINTGDRTVRLITDRDGFRVGTAGRLEGTKQILLIGDSFMEALQVEYEQSLAGLLEARLPQRLNQTVAVRNTGVGGWDPPQYLMEARRVLARERFDLALVCVYLENDVVQEMRTYPPRPPAVVHPLRWPRRLTYAEFVDAVLYPINDFLEVRSQLFIFLRTRSTVLRMRLGLSPEYFPDDLLRQEAGSARWSATAQILSDIRDAARAHGVPTLFVLIPAPYQADTAVFRGALQGDGIDPAAVDLDQPDRLLTAAMHAHHLDVFAVLSEFRSAERAGTHLYGNADRHLSPAGHELLERLVEPLIVARLASLRRHPARGVSSPAPVTTP